MIQLFPIPKNLTARPVIALFCLTKGEDDRAHFTTAPRCDSPPGYINAGLKAVYYLTEFNCDLMRQVF